MTIAKPLPLLALVFALLVSPLAALAQDKVLVNQNRQGIAVKGYDPVAFFTKNKPVKGNSAYSSQYQGATYYFASAEHKATFDQEPAKFAPQFGGFCAWAVSQGYTAPISVDAFRIVDGRLLLQYNKRIRSQFERDTQGNLARADTNWPTLVAQKGKSS